MSLEFVIKHAAVLHNVWWNYNVKQWLFLDPFEMFTHLFLSEEENEKDRVKKIDGWWKKRPRRFLSRRGFVEMHERAKHELH